MPGVSMPWIVRVVSPSSYSSSCSGSECTWISPGSSAVITSSTCWPAATSTRSPFGVTESPSKVTSMTFGSELLAGRLVLVAAGGERQRAQQHGQGRERSTHERHPPGVTDVGRDVCQNPM